MKATPEYMMKNFFPLPNQIFSLGLAAEEIAIYSYLMYLEDRKTFECHPAYRTIGGALHMSENTVRKYVHRLEDKGFIYTKPTLLHPKKGPPRNGNLQYTVRPIQEAVEIYQARQLAAMDAERAHQEAMRRVDVYNSKHPDKPVIVSANDQAQAVAAL